MRLPLAPLRLSQPERGHKTNLRTLYMCYGHPTDKVCPKRHSGHPTTTPSTRVWPAVVAAHSYGLLFSHCAYSETDFVHKPFQFLDFPSCVYPAPLLTA